MKGGDCVLVGTIYTVDDLQPKVEGVTIRDGKIVYAGEAREARRQGGLRAELVDLGDRVALPGFVESHSHPILYGRYLEEVDCRYCSSIEEIVEALRRRASVTPPGEWVIGNGYDHTLLRESRHPVRRELDRASDEHPVLLRNITVHNVVANSQALQRAGVTAETPDPKGGRIGRDANGEPDGVLWEWAQDLAHSCLPKVSVEDVHRQLENAAKEYLSAGVTSVVDAALGLANGMRDAEAYARVAGDGGLPLRLGAAIAYPLWKELQGSAGPRLEWPGEPERVRPVAVKFFQDGSIQIGTAALRQPYFGETEPADHHVIWPRRAGPRGGRCPLVRLAGLDAREWRRRDRFDPGRL